MSNEAHYEKLERMYLSAPINDFFKPRISIKDSWAEVVMPITPTLHQSAHSLHGSVYFKALDDATFFAAQSVVTDVFIVTASFNLHLLRPIVDGEIRGVGQVVSVSQRILIVDGIAYNTAGKEVARGTGTFMKTSFPLSPEIGYK